METAKVMIGLSNPKSPTNVGAVLRAAGCFAVESIFYTGNRYAQAARFRTDTKDVSKKNLLSATSALLDSVPADTQIVCVELAEGATPLPEFRHPEKAFYVFGPEDGTLGQEIIDQAAAVVYVPTIGCLNLAATVNIVLYDRLAKSTQTIAGDALIRQSRDNNNAVKVKTAAVKKMLAPS